MVEEEEEEEEGLEEDEEGLDEDEEGLEEDDDDGLEEDEEDGLEVERSGRFLLFLGIPSARRAFARACACVRPTSVPRLGEPAW